MKFKEKNGLKQEREMKQSKQKPKQKNVKGKAVSELTLRRLHLQYTKINYNEAADPMVAQIMSNFDIVGLV